MPAGVLIATPSALVPIMLRAALVGATAVRTLWQAATGHLEQHA